MASKKTVTPVTLPRGAKTAFVLSLPADMPASEVVEKAAKKGIELTPGHVYNIRSSQKAQAPGMGLAAPSIGGLAPGERITRRNVNPRELDSRLLDGPSMTQGQPRDTIPSLALDLSPEATLRSIVAEIGLARAREIMSEIEKAFRG